MMIDTDQRDGDSTPPISRRTRNARVGVGAAGLAAVLGVGAYVVTDHLTEKPPVQVAGEAVRPGQVSPESSSASPAPSPSVTTKLSPAPASTVVVPMPKSVQSRLDDARSANKRLGTGVRRPAPPAATNVDPTRVKVVQTGSNKEGRTMRVSSAALDLTGYRELAWVRGGQRHGDATCTKKITVSPDVPPKEKPTLLICWQISAKKSVYTVAVDFKGHPSVSESVAEIAEAWSAMS